MPVITQAWVLLSATHLNAQAYKPGVTDYNYTQIADPAALKTSPLNYTDATGANLTVRYHHELYALPLALTVGAAICRHVRVDAMRKAHAQAYVSYSNTSGSRPRPAVIVVPDYDGIGNYERWRADLLASLGYVGALVALSRLPSAQASLSPQQLGHLHVS